jgi:hypothetical protein
MSQWESKDLDTIVRQGDRQHLITLGHKGWPSNDRNTQLDIDEIPKEMDLALCDERVRAHLDLTDDAVFGFAKDLPELLTKAVEKHPKKSFVLRILDKCRAILHDNQEGLFGVFDPHACDAKGLPSADGVACLHLFTSLDALSAHLRIIAATAPLDHQIDIHPVSMKINRTFAYL